MTKRYLIWNPRGWMLSEERSITRFSLATCLNLTTKTEIASGFSLFYLLSAIPC